ncbi:MAG: agmatinase [Aestuariivirga sp.]|uniref:agmatinase n=1 Tax=Aestuariivirga sp. TaxID=2650926 RepID=UPI0038D0CA1D
MKNDPRFQPVDAAITPRFAGIATFMRTQRHEISPDLDIALVGVPFDIGVNYRAGARQAPAAVREASRLIRRVHNVSGIAPYDICNVADVGDAPVNPIDLARSIQMIEDFFTKIHAAGALPLTIGGDHTVPLPILRAIARERPVGVFQIDSHADTLDTLADTRINHATTFRRAVEEGLIDPKRTIQIGLRGSRFSPDDIKWGQDQGFTCITFEDYERMGRAAVIARAAEVLGDGPSYITIDIDGIDPAWAPGTGVPEIGGLTPRDVQVMLRSLQGKKLVGGDICEVAPCFDPTGVTAVTAANLMWEMLCVMAYSRVHGG